MRLTTVPAEPYPAGAVVSRAPKTCKFGQLWRSESLTETGPAKELERSRLRMGIDLGSILKRCLLFTRKIGLVGRKLFGQCERQKIIEHVSKIKFGLLEGSTLATVNGRKEP